MKKLFTSLITLLLSCILFSGCSYRIIRYGYTAPEEKKYDCNVKIKKYADYGGFDFKYIGTVRLGDKTVTANADEAHAMTVLKKEACSVNANLINIINEIGETPEEAEANHKYYCIADLYYVKPEKQHYINCIRDKFIYQKNYDFNWDYFQAEPTEDLAINSFYNSNNALFYSTIFLDYKNVNPWTGVAKYKAHAIVYKDISWVKQDFKSIEHLFYFKLLFDISELFAQKLVYELNTSYINAGNKNKVIKLYDQFIDEMRFYQKTYTEESECGDNPAKQEYWEKKVHEELVEYINKNKQ